MTSSMSAGTSRIPFCLLTTVLRTDRIGDSMVKWTITIGERQMLLQNIMTTKKEESHVRASLRTNARAAPVVAKVRFVSFIHSARMICLTSVSFDSGVRTAVRMIAVGLGLELSRYTSTVVPCTKVEKPE